MDSYAFRKFLKMVALAILAMAILFAVFCFWKVFADSIIHAVWNETDGTVTEVSTVVMHRYQGHTVVEEARFDIKYVYYVDGKEYYGSATSDVPVGIGDPIPVWYHPDSHFRNKAYPEDRSYTDRYQERGKR